MKTTILIAFICLAVQACSPTRPAKYEYVVLTDSELASEQNGTINSTSLTKALNARAADGWRLITVAPSVDKMQAGVVRREIGGSSPVPREWSFESHCVYFLERSLPDHAK